MIRNYIAIAWRLLKRHKVYSTINILGLTLGVTASLLILLYVADELSYDRFHGDHELIHRVNFHGRVKNEEINTARVGLPVAEALQREGAGVSAVLRIDKWITCPVRHEDRVFTEMNFCLADSNFFSFFDYTLVAGDPQTALTGANKIVITEDAATRYFDYKGRGDRSPIGKSLVIGSEGAIVVEVTGIAENPPGNTHLKFDFLMSLETSGYIDSPSWLNFQVFTYFKLFPGTDVGTVHRLMDEFVSKYCAKELEQVLNTTIEEFTRQGGRLGFGTQSLTDIHLTSNFQDELEPNGNIQYVHLLGAIALFILVLACINFMNLSTARSANRAREIGVRKVIGAFRGRLISQFLAESFVYTVIAFAIALFLVFVLLGPFNQLSGKELDMRALYRPAFLSGFFLLLLVVAVVAGVYPAFYLTSFKPVEVLKGRLRAGGKSAGIRNSLVVFQFFVSIALIISAFVVYGQLRFLQQQNVGFDKENVVGIMHTMSLGADAEAFRNELLGYPDFVSASYCSRLPPNVDWSSTFKTAHGDETYSMAVTTVDYDHLETLGLTMVSGRFFSRDFPSERAAVIINETAARQFGFTEGDDMQIRYSGAEGGEPMHVVGVMKDFNFESLKSNIRPLVMFLGPSPNWGMAIRLSAGDTGEKIKRLGEVWKKYAPGSPFEYSFVDQNFDSKFRAEQRLGNVILVFTALAVVIACLGLFGLATFAAEQRAKEIGIRKVMGASSAQIVSLLSVNFVKLIIIALVLAVPVAWYGMSEWLSGFAYRIGFNAGFALLAGAGAIAVALLTTVFQALRAAKANPVVTLRAGE